MTPFTLDYLARLEAWGLAILALQGVLLSISWVGWARATSRWSPDWRHRLAGAHFAALALLPAMTLGVLLLTVGGMAQAGRCGCSHPGSSLGFPVVATTLALLWLGGAAVMVVRLTVQWRRLSRLRRVPASAVLAARVRNLGGPQVRVSEASISSPQVSGLRRPVLLLPLGIGGWLAPDELDAVLLHELAHIARRDFAWNLVQRGLLAVLWFHPAAWWLYTSLRREREIRCDALAVRRGASARALARALLRLAEAQTASPLAMTLSGGAELSIRLRWLLQPRDGRHASPSRWGRAAAASALCLLALGAGRLALLEPSTRDSYVASAFGPTLLIRAHDPAGTFAVQVRQGRVIAASVAEHRLAPTHIRQTGGQVVLLGGGDKATIALTVSPQGSIFWDARS